jgi:hypothetical protein
VRQQLIVLCALSLVVAYCSNQDTTSEIDVNKLAAANRSAVANDVETLAKRAQQFFYRPAELGGGGQSFAGMGIEAITAKPNNKNGSYTIREKSEGSAIIVGTGHEIGADGVNPVRVSVRVTKDAIETTVEN